MYVTLGLNNRLKYHAYEVFRAKARHRNVP